MAGEIDIINLFGALSLDATSQEIVTKLVANETALNLIKGLVQSTNTKTLKVDTDHISGAVTITAFPEGQEPLTDAELRAAPVAVTVQFPTSQKVHADSLPLPTDAAKDTTSIDIKNLTSAIKALVESNGTILTALNNKITKMDSDQVTLKNYLGLTDVELRATPLNVDVEFPTSQKIHADVLPLANNAATEVSLAALKAVSDDIKVLTSSIKDLITTNNNTLAAVNTKIVKQDTDNVGGTVAVSGSALPAGAATEATLQALNVISTNIDNAVDAIGTLVTTINNKILKQDTDHIAGVVSVSATSGLTDAQLRAAAVPVLIGEMTLPTGASTEVAVQSLISKADEILTKLNSSLIKVDSDNTGVSLNDFRSAAALRVMNKQQYDANNRLLVANTGSTSVTGTVTVTGTVNALLGNNSPQAWTVNLSRLGFYKTLERITFT